MMALSRELAVFVAPFINSYKRYASLSWAPVNVVWGRDNRTTGFRLVGHGPSLHVENRFPGGDMNAYLTYAAMVGAGLYGIEHGLKLEPEFKGNGYLATGRPADAAGAVRGDLGAGAVRGGRARSSARTSSTTTSTPRASSRRRTTRSSTRGTASATSSGADDRRPVRVTTASDPASAHAARSTATPARRSRQALYRIADAASAGRGPARVLRLGPRDRRRADLRARTSTSRCTTRSASGSTSRTTSTSVDPDIPDPTAWEPFGVGDAAGPDGLRPAVTGGRLLFTQQRSAGPRSTRGEIEPGRRRRARTGSASRSAPRAATIGVVVVQTYDADEHYDDADVDAPRRSSASTSRRRSTRARAIEETRQRNAELSLINEIGRRSPSSSTSGRSSSSSASGCASCSTASRCSSRSTTPATQRISFPYEIDDGERDPTGGPFAFGQGLTSIVIRDAPAAPHRDRAEAGTALGAIDRRVPISKSWLGVPILAGDEVIGVHLPRGRGLARVRRGRRAAARHARVEHGRGARERPPVRRDQAAARRDGPARRRARGHQRDRQRARRSSSTSTAIIELVGERVRAIFELRVDVHRACTTRRRTRSRSRTSIDEGERFDRDPRRARTGPDLDGHPHAPTAAARDPTTRRARSGAIQLGGIRRPQSWLGVPILAGDRVIGVIGLETPRARRLHRGRRAAARDARLEHGRRARERAPVRRDEAAAHRDRRARRGAGDHQRASSEGLAAQLDMQAMYDLVGDKIQEIFDAQVVDIGIYDREAERDPLPVHDRARRALPGRARSDRRTRLGRSSSRAQPLRRSTTSRRGTRALGADARSSRASRPQSIGSRRSIVGGEVRGEHLAPEPRPTRTRSARPTCACSTTLAVEPERRARERPAVRRDEAAADRDRRAGRRAGDHQRASSRASPQQLDMQAMYDLVGDKIQEIFDAQVVDIGIVDREAGLIHFPYTIERGVRFPDEPMPDRRAARRT